MTTKQLDIKEAREHLRDSEDILAELVRNIKRVVKSYPTLEPLLSSTNANIDALKSTLGEAKQELSRAV